MHRLQTGIILLAICAVPLMVISCEIRDHRLSDAGEEVYVVKPRVYETKRRRRRDINSSVYYEDERKLKIVELGDWVVELEREHDLFPSGETTWIGKDGTVETKKIKGCEHRSGRLRHAAHSIAAITFCDTELRGFFSSDNKFYFIEPTTGTDQRQKRSERWDYFNLTGDTLDITDETDESEFVADEREPAGNKSLEWNRERIDSEDVGYFYDVAWQPTYTTWHSNGRTSTNPKRWMEIAVAVDATVINFHGKKLVEQYILALMNIVNAIYQDPSLDANMQLVVNKFFLYENSYKNVIRMGDAKQSLQNVNIWNRQLHLSLAPGETHHDVAVWLTRSDIGGPSGYAPVAGTCDPERSCALNRDEGLTSAFIIAHEMAHILGLRHDGDTKSGNNCAAEAQQASVMADIVTSTFNYFFWSPCSKKEFAHKSRKWSCLLNPPKNPNALVLNSTLETGYNMDEQCRMEFGEGYTLCRAFDIVEPCSHLWCGHVNSPLVCKTKKGPPLEGTECGFGKVCVDGYCQRINKDNLSLDPVQHNPQDGGWGDWGKWGGCSRTCGAGVEFRVRKCDNPPPIYGGSDCFGSKEEWRICSAAPCPEPLRDIRAQQCKRLARLLQLNPTQANMTWLPFESEDLEIKCKLICSSLETKELYVTGENLIDGTPCSYENRSNICIQGVCQPLGCDRKLFSTKQEDSCGICGGNNKDCVEMKRNVNRKLKRDVNRISIFPRFARDIKVEANFSASRYQTTHQNIVFVLKDRKKKSYSITVPNIRRDNQIIEGAKFYYKMNENTHLLWSKGPLLAEIILLVYVTNNQIEQGLNISLRTKFYLQKELLNENKFQWIIGGWGPCSKSCDCGKRIKTKACWDISNRKIVPRKFCALVTKPELESENCNNFSCNFHWASGMWEPCSTTCGSYGTQTREIYCMPQSAINDSSIFDYWKLMVDPNKCGDTKPATQRACYRRPCPVYWEYGQWSQCSSTCGLGFTVRDSYCMPPTNETLYACVEKAPKQRKECNEIYNGRGSKFCKKRTFCLKDASEYCSLPQLARYCNIRGYRKLCCKTCSKLRIVSE